MNPNGLHDLPVSSTEPGPDIRNMRLRSLVIACTASAAAEFGTSAMTSTCSVSIHLRAMLAAMSGLF
ncbi:hypothetical protein D3C71_2146030 [compost metagenome]